MAKLVDKVTPVSPAEVLGALGRAWTKTFGQDAERKSLLVLLSQWALETGRGKSMHCYNLGNVKSTGQTGDWCFFRCNEILNGKVEWFDPEHPQTRFRAFGTLDEGALDYLTALHRRFEKSWPAVLAGEPAAFVHALRLQNYFTANEATYTKTVVSLFEEFSRTLPSSSASSSPSAAPAGPAAKGALPDLYTTQGVQRALIELGYDPGTPDGIEGPNTQAAICSFQGARGLLPDGVVGRITRSELAEAWAEQHSVRSNGE
jgi:hypothetical protein